jgi:predicted nuclease with RNAse H fold
MMVEHETTVAGIDVGGTRKGFHLVILQGREFLHVACVHDAAQLHASCVAFDARVIGIDAPGRWRAGAVARSAELAMARERISCFSTPTEQRANASTSGFYGWMFNGLDVYRAFAPTHPASREMDYRGERVCIETFPHAITCALRGRDATSARDKRRQRK